MNSISIALWIIAVEGLFAVVILLFFLLGMRKDLSNTLKETQTLLRTLEEKVANLSNELNNTLKNTSDITYQAKQSLKKVDRFLTLLGGLELLVPLVAISRSSKNTKESSVFSKIATFATLIASVQRGFNIYRKITGKEEK